LRLSICVEIAKVPLGRGEWPLRGHSRTLAHTTGDQPVALEHINECPPPCRIHTVAAAFRNCGLHTPLTGSRGCVTGKNGASSMQMKLDRVACVLRGGHRWETTTDVVGTVTACPRCGKVSHSRSPKGASRPNTPLGVAEGGVDDFESRNSAAW
jgi:hypothetical protein